MIGIEIESLIEIVFRVEMRIENEGRRSVTCVFQGFGNRQESWVEAVDFDLTIKGSMFGGVCGGEKGRDGSMGVGFLAECPLKNDALRRETVDERARLFAIAVAAEMIGPKGVYRDPDDIRQPGMPGFANKRPGVKIHGRCDENRTYSGEPQDPAVSIIHPGNPAPGNFPHFLYRQDEEKNDHHKAGQGGGDDADLNGVEMEHPSNGHVSHQKPVESMLQISDFPGIDGIAFHAEGMKVNHDPDGSAENGYSGCNPCCSIGICPGCQPDQDP